MHHPTCSGTCDPQDYDDGCGFEIVDPQFDGLEQDCGNPNALAQ